MTRSLLLVTIATILIACNRIENNPGSSEKKYFDLESLIKDQVKILSSLQPELEKKVFIDGQTELLKSSPDSNAWEAELELFRQADLNKPVLRDLYSVEETEPGDDVRIISYCLNQKGEDGVQSLKIYKDPVSGDLKKIESHLKSSNVLFGSDRRMEMHFSRYDRGDLFLSGYQITGSQKIILKDTVIYKIEAKINYN